jgi:predicted acylesterase/phospholipase RssA
MKARGLKFSITCVNIYIANWLEYTKFFKREHLMFKILLFSFVSVAVQGCGTFKSVPYPTSFNSLDAKAVRFNLNIPKVNLSSLQSQSNRKKQILTNKDILVSVSGGGARASAFSLGVLAELEKLGQWTSSKDNINALQEIDYYSTVSGGGWGVASYLANKEEKGTLEYSLNDNLKEIRDNFIAFSSEDVECLPEEIEKHVTKGLKLGDLFNQDKNDIKHPYLFVNGTIYSNQSPFIFTQEFSDYFRVDEFLACGGKVTYKAGANFNDIPISYAVSTSGSVPGFYHNYASTNICNSGSDLSDSFFCAKGKSRIDKLTLVDGGIYDNYGYQTALEIISQGEGSKLIIVIDSNADTEIPFERELELSKSKVGIGALKKAGFPARTAAYNRMFKQTAASFGADIMTLDFFSTADITNKLNGRDIEKLLFGLDTLTNHAKTNVFCFDDDGVYLNNKKVIKEKGNSSDCKANNYFRSGLMGKTTYKFDSYYFSILEELGRLAVRLNADEIKSKMYN